MSISPFLTVDPQEHSHAIERRVERRRKLRGSVLVKVADSADLDQVGRSFRSKIINVSARGMSLSAHGLMNGCVLDVWVGVDGYLTSLHLVGEVVWASWEETGAYQMGIELMDRPDTDLVEWREVHSNTFSRS